MQNYGEELTSTYQFYGGFNHFNGIFRKRRTIFPGMRGNLAGRFLLGGISCESIRCQGGMCLRRLLQTALDYAAWETLVVYGICLAKNNYICNNLLDQVVNYDNEN